MFYITVSVLDAESEADVSYGAKSFDDISVRDAHNIFMLSTYE